MASTEYLPFQSNVQVKQEDNIGVSALPEKTAQLSKPPSAQEIIVAQLQQQLSQTSSNPQNDQQIQPSAPGHNQHTKHAVPFSGLSFHNPFDINSYPITNPPLYDPTMHVPYGGTRHRRISISNGQIGQIVNHEAYFMDDDSLDELTAPERQRGFPDDTFADTNSASQVNGMGANIGGGVGGGNQWNMNANRTGINPLEMPTAVPLNRNGLVRGEVADVAGGASNDVGAPVAATQMKQSNSPVAGLPPPNHTLIYNNEVIYNPNDGPIPGSAAWKKERLLERNRVAASKCRQRKKQAQQQLQRDISKFESAIKDKEVKIEKYEKLFAMYNSVLKEHFGGSPHALEALRPFVENPEI